MKRAATPKPFSPYIQLCRKCRERTFWAKVSPSLALVLLERDPNPYGTYTVARMERRTPIVMWAYAGAPYEAAPEGEPRPRYSAHLGRCPGPR